MTASLSLLDMAEIRPPATKDNGHSSDRAISFQLLVWQQGTDEQSFARSIKCTADSPFISAIVSTIVSLWNAVALSTRATLSIPV